MTATFTIEMLPACEGDCLWITYGPPGELCHILVDGGRKSTAKAIRNRLAALKDAGRQLELVIVSHVDRDHIEGLLEIAESRFEGVGIGDIWFNGYEHLSNGYVPFGAIQGERLGNALVDHELPWNEAAGRHRIAIEAGAPVVAATLPGGMKLTLLSPTPAKLAAMQKVWKKEVEAAGMVPGVKPKKPPPGFEILGGGAINVEALAALQFHNDDAAANGSSIAVLAEYGGKRALLAADAHADTLTASIKALGNGAPLKLDAFKIAHHGSAHNVSRDMLEAVDCRRFLLSTNGSYFNHPDRMAIARIIRYADQPELIFNYASEETQVWDDQGLREQFGYTVRYPPEKNGYHAVTL